MSKPVSAYQQMQADWHRWQMQDLEDNTNPTSPTVEPDTPTQQEILAQTRNLHEQAQERGYQEGYAAGHQQGLENGEQQGRQQGHDLGYQDGYQAGMDKAQAELADHAHLFEQLADRGAESLDKLYESMGQALIKLSTRIAEHMLGQALMTHPEHVLGLVQQVLSTEPDEQSLLTLSLHPDDLAIVQPYLPKHGGTRPWRLQADKHLARGDCVARSAYGDIDATLGTRWRRCLAALSIQEHEQA